MAISLSLPVKKLGTTIIELKNWIQRILDKHLSDNYTYKILTPQEGTFNTEKLQYKISNTIVKQREEINEADIHFLHRYMGENRDSNLYLLMKIHNKISKKWAIIDTKRTLLVPVYIWVYFQLKKAKHLLTTPIQYSI